MKLQQVLRNGYSLTYDRIENRQLATQIQSILCWHGLLESEPDGWFGRISTYALCQFQKIHGIEESYLGAVTAKTLINTHPDKTKALMQSIKDDFLNLAVETMKLQGFNLNQKPGEINILFVEGANLDYSLNPDTPNVFNDLCLVFDFVGDNPQLLGKWIATADPGRYYTDNPLNPAGALHHNGQSRAWQVGWHKDHQALVQVKSIPITRDYNKDFRTAGDKQYNGFFGANCHGSNTNNVNDISRWSAGCKVLFKMFNFRDFMSIVKRDRNYQANKKHLFEIATLEGTQVLDLIREDRESGSFADRIHGCKVA